MEACLFVLRIEAQKYIHRNDNTKIESVFKALASSGPATILIQKAVVLKHLNGQKMLSAHAGHRREKEQMTMGWESTVMAVSSGC